MEQCKQELPQPAKTTINAFDTDLKFKLVENDLLLDLKALMKEYYCGTFTEDEKGLKLKFTNGQNFILTIKEITKE